LQWKIGASSGTMIAGNGTSGAQATQLNSPNRISFDSSGSLYVADTLNNRIQKYLISCRKFNLYIDPTDCLFFCSSRVKYLDHNSFISNNNR
jgi:sugar lactone lactonase YvrE